MKNRKIQWITRTAIFVALLVAVQWASAFTQVFAGQYITGSLVNCVLAVAVLLGGLGSGVTVALVSPVCAFLLGIGPKLVQIVPCIAVGNAVYVLILWLFLGRKRQSPWLQAVGLGAAAATKFLTLYTAVIKLVIPLMGDALKAPQVQTFTAMFSWPQLVTAIIGGTVALLLLPVLHNAIKE